MIGVMLFVVSPKMKELMLTAGGGIIILLFVYLLTANSYRNERVQIWLHPESHKGISDDAGIICDRFRWDFWKRTWAEYAEDGIYSRITQ